MSGLRQYAFFFAVDDDETGTGEMGLGQEMARASPLFSASYEGGRPTHLHDVDADNHENHVDHLADAVLRQGHQGLRA